jgi:membrane-associated phospholipid phosphatase
MTLIAAPMSVLWLRLPRWRWLWSAVVAMVACGLVGANYHFLSDIIAGSCLGIATGVGMVALVGRGGT